MMVSLLESATGPGGLPRLSAIMLRAVINPRVLTTSWTAANATVTPAASTDLTPPSTTKENWHEAQKDRYQQRGEGQPGRQRPSGPV